jgi:hypothetical protein
MMSVLEAVLMHAKKHVTYPTTKKDLVEACNNFSDVPKAEKEWFEKNLPAGTYKSANEVLGALLNKV